MSLELTEPLLVEPKDRKQESQLKNLKEPKWYVFYTHPKAEKVVYRDLLKRGYDAFLPLRKEIHKWKNRQTKLVELPIFPNYIFVKAKLYELPDIKRLSKIVTYITIGNRPSTISSKELDTIKKASVLEMNMTIENSFCEGESVKIVDGPLTGSEGIILNHKGKTRFGILLNDLKHTVLIDICGHHLLSNHSPINN